MQRIPSAIALVLTAALAATMALDGQTPAWANPLDNLGGYWTGGGQVALTNGKTERVKCAVTYKVADNGTQVRQSMRCASADYTINASAELRVSGANVTGSWEEKTYSATGQVTGRYSGTTFALNIKGANFTAAMNVNTTGCKQNISIAPQGLDVTRISIGLAKC